MHVQGSNEEYLNEAGVVLTPPPAIVSMAADNSDSERSSTSELHHNENIPKTVELGFVAKLKKWMVVVKARVFFFF